MSIDSIYEAAIAKLTSEGKILNLSKELLSLTNNDERVLYVYEVLENFNSFPKVLEVNKSQNVSTYYRNLGNQCYQKSEDHMAWQYYNLSLLHAPMHSHNYSLALANRSAVFFSLKKYKECLEDIEELFPMEYPDKLKDKLIKRQLACKQELSKNSSVSKIEYDISKLLVLQEPKDSRYICASSKLEVVFNTEMGRHVVAKEDIRVGEVLAHEEPYLTLLLTSQYLFYCSFCLSRNLNLLPCDSCCFILYCSKQCKENAWKEYHKVECPLIPTLVHMEFTKLELLALRTVVKARTGHSDWASLFSTIKEAEANASTEFRGHVKINDNWVFDSKYYASIHTLASNVEKRSISDIFQKSVTAAVFLKLLSDGTDFLKSQSKDELELIRKCVAGTLLLHVMTSPTNMHGISSNMETAEGNFVDEINIASAPYAFHSLLNHSCTPNVVRFSKWGTGHMTLFALRPIKKGMQLFDNYGSHHALQDRGTRQKVLKSQYKFTCLCEACVNEWPIYVKLRPAKNLAVKIKKRKETLLSSDTIEKLQKGDKSKAFQIFRELCDLTETLDSFAPCIELADCQEALKQCLVIFEGLVPYGYSKLVEWDVIPPELK